MTKFSRCLLQAIGRNVLADRRCTHAQAVGFPRGTNLLVAGVLVLVAFLGVSTTALGQVYPSYDWYKTYGGDSYDYISRIRRTPDNNLLFIGSTESSDGDIPNQHGSADLFVVKTNPVGEKIWSKAYGSVWSEAGQDGIITSDGGALLVGNIFKYPASFPDPQPGDVSDPGPIPGSGYDYDGWMIRIDANGNKLWDLRVGTPINGVPGVGQDFLTSVVPATDGGFLVGGISGNAYWIVKVSSTGQKLWEKKLGADCGTMKIAVAPDGGYLLAGDSGPNNPDRTGPAKGNPDTWLVKIDAFGNKQWDRTIGTGPGAGVYLKDLTATADGGFLLLSAAAGPASGDKTAPDKGTGYSDYWVVKLDASGAIRWDAVYGSSGYAYPKAITEAADGSFFVSGTSNGAGGDRTDSSDEAPWILKASSSGTKIWAKTVAIDGWFSVDYGSVLAEPDGGVIVGLYTEGYLQGTQDKENKGAADYKIVKLGCAFSTNTVLNNISPATQTACVLGTPGVITGTDDDNLYPDYITYQWQRSNNGVDGWADLPVGVNRDYLPEPSANTLYYRRIARWECHADTSNTAAVVIDSRQAPTLTMGGPYTSCPGSPVTLGLTPPASGGVAPYAYAWDNAGYLDDSTKANPVATLTASGIFTVTVTDGAGCRKTGQAIVSLPPPAVAGPDRALCPGGAGIRIGTDPLVGFGTVTYAWSPAAGLDNPNVARPVASPAATTTYTLTVSYTNSDGQACSLTDQVVVSVATTPLSGFAGPDKTICSGTTTTIGAGAQPGFTYTWSPGIYLEQNNAAQATFRPGTPFPPVVDPIRYTVTATDGLCTYTDEVVVTVIRANAGWDGCGPRTIGTPDLTPNVSETYHWTRLGTSTGTGNFTGTTDLPQVPVSGTSAGADVYQLSVAHGGTTCLDTVIVPICGSCGVDFVAEGGNCLVYNGKPLRLIADNGGSTEFVYTWSPAVGLSSTTGPVVYLLDDVNRTYTVTKTRVSNPSDACSVSKQVNPPAASFPVFSAPDVAACDGTTLTIGAPAVSGYVYNWTGPGGFTSSSSSPALTVSDGTVGSYVVKVNDTNPGNPGGCFTQDTVRVSLETVTAPQANWTVCENAVIRLGAPDPSGGKWTYSWTPAVAAWQNGTGPSSVQPEVLVTTNTTFSVTVTNPSGCSATANSTVTVTNSPTIANAADIADACPGSTVQIGSPALPGVTYSWSPATGLSDPTAAQPIVTVGGAGSSVTYTVTATFPGSCSAVATDQVTVNALNNILDLGSDIVYCPSAGAVAIGNNVPTGSSYTYSWTPSAGLSNPTSANPTTSVTVPTEYTLRITFPNGCSGTGKVKVIPASAPDAGSDRTVCYGSSAQLGSSANAASTAWSGTGAAYLSSATGAVVTFNAAGTAPAGVYTLTATQTANGCTNSDPVTITVAPRVTAPSGSATLCLGGTRTIGTAPEAGYTYEWLPVTGLSTPNQSMTQVTLSSPGSYTYTLRVKNMAAGCVASGQYVVTVLPTGAPAVSVSDMSACLNTSRTMAATVSPSAGNYSYSWSPATDLSDPYVLNPTLTANNSRTYTLSVTDQATGCASQASGTVTVDYLTGNYITTGPESVAACPNSAVSFSANVSAGMAYSFRWQKWNSSTSVWEDMTDGGLYSGVQTLTLHISDNTTLGGAQFRIMVTATSCGVQQGSNVATLTVNQCLKSSLGDRVWDDTDRDGTQDAGEPGVPGIAVTLYRNGTLLAQTTTDQNGNYLFDNLDANDPFGQPYAYQVGFGNLPGGYVFTTQGSSAGSNGAGTAVDSDVNTATGLSRPITLGYNQHLPDVDAGIHSNTPLPVTLISFTGRSSRCDTELFWAVAAETGFSHYEIQYSGTGDGFHEVGRVVAAGSNSRYSFRPPQVNGVAYYRLRMVDLDGSVSYSRVLSFVTDCQDPITVYPNPAAQSVRFSYAKGIKSVTIYDARGAAVGTFRNIGPGEKVSVAAFPDGFYLLKGETEDGREFNSKLVINR